MNKWSFFQFLKASGRIGGGSVIFAFVLFAIAIWEHYKGKNIPASLLVTVGVFFFCYGCYLAWKKELDSKNDFINAIKLPHFNLLAQHCAWEYSEDDDQTILIFAINLVNEGGPSLAHNWSGTIQIGRVAEEMKPLHVTGDWYIRDARLEGVILIRPEDQIVSKTLEGRIETGQGCVGRIFYSLPGNRMAQLGQNNFSAKISCTDFLARPFTTEFIPHTAPVTEYKVFPGEKIIKRKDDKNA